MNYWVRKVANEYLSRKIQMGIRQLNKNQGQGLPNKLNLMHLSGIFITLIIGILLAIIVFIAELLTFKLKNLKITCTIE